jgi:ADP-heptose:LPS heptosyltransferase
MLVHAGRRGPRPDSVRRILAVKLDHIGDFLTALPALRSLQRHFPAARIDLLAAAATAELARSEPLIAETIVFDFFHARSGEGRRGVSDADYAALAARLAPVQYDIAIDLRMHPDTREVLPHTGAALLAGYDHANRFPFLDLALEWEGDIRDAAKRAHISERLVQLVAATHAACIQEAAPPDPPPLPPSAVPALARLPAGFLGRPIVCVHPGVGNAIRQWPATHFAGLIDLLAEAGLHAILIGAPSETAIAKEVLAQVATRASVHSLVGAVKLADLPDVMRACVLFVGNNSGPQHLAASLGLPTLGIHSGVVDATEWAPLGTQAAAIRRRMVCSPCYLEFASDCPRNLACLEGLRPRDVFEACKRLLVNI